MVDDNIQGILGIMWVLVYQISRVRYNSFILEVGPSENGMNVHA